MIKHGLLLCSFQLKTKYKKEDYYSLNSEYEYDDIRYKNVFELFTDFCKNYETYTNDEKQMKMFAIDKRSISTVCDKETTVLTCKILCGSYGIKSSMTNKDTKKVVYTRKKEDADIKPFQFMIYVPKDTKKSDVIKGVFVFEMVGTYGVKTITTTYMKRFFSEKYGLTIEIRNISVRLMLERMLQKNKLGKITFIRNRISQDLSDDIFYNVGKEEKTYYSPKLKTNWVRKLLDFVDGSCKDTEIFEIENSKYEDIKFTFSLSGRSRTVRLMEMERFSFVEDIPDDLYDDRGEINEGKLRQYMMTIASSYIGNMIYTRQ